MSAESRDAAWVRVPSLAGMTVPDARRVHLAGQWQSGA